MGSINVKPEAMRRACYMVKVLFADNYHLRNAYYRMSGRVGVIADNENTTSIPEHSRFRGQKWVQGHRGLGPTVGCPITTGGGDNCLCQPGQR